MCRAVAFALKKNPDLSQDRTRSHSLEGKYAMAVGFETVVINLWIIQTRKFESVSLDSDPEVIKGLRSFLLI